MALIQCPECKKEISDNATKCPRMYKLKYFLWFLIIHYIVKQRKIKE